MIHAAHLIGDGVALRPLGIEDVSQEYVDWLNDPDVVAFTEQRGRQHSLKSVHDYVCATLQAPDAMIWRIICNDRHVGNIRLSEINKTHARAACALMIGVASARNRGVGRSAIDLIARHALGALQLHKLTAGIYATNPASRRAFERAGFRLEATLRGHARFGDAFIDVWQMARFADGPPSR
jgi:RimJ/RimL family protein N-acetyltransferase